MDTLRSSIDRLDGAIADLLLRRGRLAQRIALVKLLSALPRRDPTREADVRRRYERRLAPHGWTPRSLDAWISTLISVSRDLQGTVRVAIQGGRGSWSEESLTEALPGVEALTCDTFGEAWAAARDGRAAAAWLPVHNSTIGTLGEVAELVAGADAWLESTIAIDHALVAPETVDLEDIRTVLAHPRALEQCRATLARLVPGAELRPTPDGAHSLDRLNRAEGSAVVGSPRLAHHPGLRVLAHPVNDTLDNATMFRLLVPREVY